VLKPLGIIARTIMHPHLLQRRSARKSASRLSYRGFARMIADQDLAANKREIGESNVADEGRKQITDIG
jgi:hypothetical protein